MTGSQAALHFEIYRGRAGLAAVADEWRELSTRAHRTAFYHRPEWFAAHMEGLASNPERVCFMVVRRAGRAVALAPLERQIRWRGGLRYRALVFPQDTFHLPAGDVTLAADEEPSAIVPVLLDHCQTHADLRWDAVQWEMVPRASCGVAALHRLGRYSRLMRHHGFRSVVSLKPFEEMLKSLSHHNRGRLRTAQHRLDRAGGGVFRTVREPAELERALEQFMDVEASGWKGRMGTAVKQIPRLRRFYEALVRECGTQGICDIHLLLIDGRPAAGTVAVVAGGTSFAIKVAYDEAYAPLSPGMLLFAYAMQYYYERTAVRTWDFVGDFSYMRMWNPHLEPEISVSLFDRSLGGACAYAGIQVDQAARWTHEHAMRWPLRKAARIARRLLGRPEPAKNAGRRPDAGPMPFSRWAAEES